MSTAPSSNRARIWGATIAAGIAFALLVPGAAFANTATFSSRTPAPGSGSTDKRPSESVKVYDKYGAHGSGAIKVTIDGKTVSASVTYSVTGGFDPSHPDYRRFKVSYRPPRSLSIGTHKVTVRIKDKKKKVSTTSWTFKVQSPPAPYDSVFSSPSPAKGAVTTVNRPTVSVKVYNKYGIKGASKYSMEIDDVDVSPSVTYAKSGDYRTLTVAWRSSPVMSVGLHVVSCYVTDIKGNDTKYTWSFTINAPDPVYEDMPVAGTACTDCHVGYPTAHPMTQCQLCHGPGRPVLSVRTPADESAHTPGCALETPCHGVGGSYPHGLSSDCASCHNGRYSGIPVTHTLAVESLHVAPSGFCTAKGCHLTSLTKEHYRYTISGQRGSCATCHGSTDANVEAAIASGSTACLSCHDFSATVHAGTSTAHAAAGSCVAAGCHQSDVTAIHKGNCDRCHATGSPSTQCANCHTAGAYHSGEASAHTVPAGGCIGDGCHGSSAGGSLDVIHQSTCSFCHTGTGTPSATCTSCHGSDTLALHTGAAAAHAADDTLSCTTSSCHGTDVTVIHDVSTGGPGCAACHASGQTPSKVCADCHDANVNVVHAKAAASHAATDTTCISSECHPNGDVTAIHDIANGGPGCVCHEPGKTTTLTCSSAGCHPGTLPVVHAAAGASHTTNDPTCVSDTCHASDVTAIHSSGDDPPGCVACHKSGQQLTTQCTACHSADLLTVHANADAKHATAPDMCVTACHSTNVAEIHTNDGPNPPGCSACHAVGKNASTTCANCHTGTTQQLHASAGAFHTVANNGCVMPGCHGGDVTELHINTGGQGCARCHSPNQTPTTECVSCHGSDLVDLHADADTLHTVIAGSCTGSNCHSPNVATIHTTGANAPGCGACHGVGKTLTTDCSVCHPTDGSVHQPGDSAHTLGSSNGCSTPTCHTSGNVAEIHQGATKSCLVCHDPSIQTQTTVCATCHPASDIPTLHASADGLHTAPAGTCVATGCHDGNVLRLHVSGPGCGVCHGAGAPTTLVCTTSGCHSSNTSTVHSAGAIPHTAHAGYCVRSGCHSGDLTSIHDANGTGIGCAACHAPDATPSGACTDCHPSTASEVHASSDTSHTVTQSTCAGYSRDSPCHHIRVDSIHTTGTNPPGCVACHAPGTTASTTCADCHNGDEAPTHASAATSHTAETGLCVNGGCHSSDVSVIHAMSDKSCLACHGPDATPSVTCGDCHTEDVFTIHPSAPSLHAVPSGTSCIADGCHSGTDVSVIHGVEGGPGCAACHGAGVTATTDCTDAACHGTDFAVTHAVGDLPHTLPGIPPTTNCVRSGCHTGNAVALHANGPGCAACHSNPDHAPSIVCTDCHPYAGSSFTVHLPYIGTDHNPEANECTIPGCHSGTVTSTHSAAQGVYSDEVPPGCVPCHGDGGTLTVHCATCHSGADAPTHPDAVASHTVAAGGNCAKDGCHSTDVTVIHADSDQSCAACHANKDGHDPTTDCSVCHFGSFTTAHPAPAEFHTASVPTCVKSGCHSSDVVAIHTTGTDAPGCAACHSNPDHDPNLDCTVCHFSSFTTDHPAPAQDHTSSDGCVGSCHDGNVATIHTTGTNPPGCVACHDGVKTPSTTCADCHASGTYHTGATESHTASPQPSCTAPGCHAGGTDVSSIHSAEGCSTCHTGNPSKDCQASGCHGTNDSIHVSYSSGVHTTETSVHTSVVDNACNNGGCHEDCGDSCHGGPKYSGDLPGYHATHGGCAACHTPGTTTTTPCQNCHDINGMENDWMM